MDFQDHFRLLKLEGRVGVRRGIREEVLGFVLRSFGALCLFRRYDAQGGEHRWINGPGVE